MIKRFENRIFGKTIVIKAENELEAQANTIFSILGTFDSNEITEGKIFEIGFNIFTIKEIKDEYFVCSQDYQKNPFVDLTEDLTLQLWIQLEQTHFLRKMNIQGMGVRFDDKVIYTEGAFESDSTYLERSGDVSTGDSGWFYGIREQENEKLKGCYAFQLLHLKRNLIQYLALPNDYLVVLEGNNLKAVLNEDNQNILND